MSGALLYQEQTVERHYAEYRSLAPIPANEPLVRVTFKAEAKGLAR